MVEKMLAFGSEWKMRVVQIEEVSWLEHWCIINAPTVSGGMCFLLSYFLLHISGHGGIWTASPKQQFAQVCTTLHFYPQNK